LEKQPAPLVVDVGTGSGCIAVTLAAELPQAKVLATDSSAAALKIARANARRHGVAKRVRLVKADLLPLRISASPPLRISAVIANLPYLPTRDLAKLSPDIRLHEPRTALDGGRDGLEPYRHLIKKLRHWPSPPAHLFLEILPGQYRPLAAIVTKNFPSAVCRKITNPAGVRVGLRADI
jgi:release factor glutamine methyltransferase